MKEYFYCLDGQTVDGPHSEREMKELFVTQKLASETPVCPAGEKEWLPLGSIAFSDEALPLPVLRMPELPPADAEQPLDHQAIAEAGNDRDDEAGGGGKGRKGG